MCDSVTSEATLASIRHNVYEYQAVSVVFNLPVELRPSSANFKMENMVCPTLSLAYRIAGPRCHHGCQPCLAASVAIYGVSLGARASRPIMTRANRNGVLDITLLKFVSVVSSASHSEEQGAAYMVVGPVICPLVLPTA